MRYLVSCGNMRRWVVEAPNPQAAVHAAVRGFPGDFAAKSPARVESFSARAGGIWEYEFNDQTVADVLGVVPDLQVAVRSETER